jgi:hypothetical protein
MTKDKGQRTKMDVDSVCGSGDERRSGCYFGVGEQQTTLPIVRSGKFVICHPQFVMRSVTHVTGCAFGAAMTKDK